MDELRVLGAFEARVDGHQVDLGGPRQRAVLALLLVARGHVVSVDRIVDDLWRGEPPPRATGALQAYVSHLRRALEPHREPRAPARVLVSAAPGYAVRLPDEAVDAWRFERLLQDAATAPDLEARRLLEEALGLWRGAAYAEVAGEPWAMAEASRLEELRLLARERLALARVATGAAAEAVPDVEALTRDHPLREEGWRVLALALHACGRQADALAALRRARAILADELGLDPGAALVELEAALLAQEVQLPGRPAPARPTPALGGPAPTPQGPVPTPRGPTAGEGRGSFVGREEELGALRAAAAAATAGSRVAPTVALVAGEAGSGKSALLDRVRAELAASGWRVAVGRCPEAEGAPPAWAWVQALRDLTSRSSPAPDAAGLAPLLADPPAGAGPSPVGGPGAGPAAEGAGDALTGRFRLHRSVAEFLATPDGGPVAVLLDDLHRADAETLSLLRSVLELWPGTGASLLLVGAYRPGEGTDAFEDALAALALRSPARVRLRGLSERDAAHLVTQVCGGTPDRDTVAALTRRTDGNPFYLRESALLLASEGALVATSEVPQGVRDVLRRRFSRLPEVAVSVLRLAAVAGRDVDVDVLLAAAEADEDAVLDALEVGVVAGLLTEPAPGRLRFSHALVRETLYSDIPGPRRTRWHARMARALELVRPDDLTALALHHARAVTPATALRALDHSLRAADLAERRYAYDTAMELYRQGLDCLARATAVEDRDERRIAVLGRLMQAALRAGATVEAVRARDEAVHVAERAGRDDLLLAALCAWSVPTPWITRSYGTVHTQLVGHVERLLGSAALSPDQRCRLLCLLVRETAGEPGSRAPAAAAEAVALARGQEDPTLLGLSLAATGEVTGPDLHTDVRAGVARELLALGREHGLVVFEALGHHVSRLVAAVRNDLAGFEEHLEAERVLGERYQLAPITGTWLMGQGFLAHAQGRFDEAEERYGVAGEAIRRHGAFDADGIAQLAVLTVHLTRPGPLPAWLPWLESALEEYGTVVADACALALLTSGDVARARAVRRDAPPLREDFFWLVLTGVRALAAIALGEGDEVAALHRAMLPFDDRLMGAGTGSYTVGPVALVLGDCALALGDREAAVRHYRAAAGIARRWQAQPWEARAEAAAERAAAGGPPAGAYPVAWPAAGD